MSDINTAILDAAEARMRLGGFNGFSFRDIAADVGIKSSSVHYHFPTKEVLAAAVIHRYAAKTIEYINQQLKAGLSPIAAWTKLFHGTLHTLRMCPAVVVGAGCQDLPPEVATEIRRFFSTCLTEMGKLGLSPADAAQLLATVSGALLIANATDDFKVFDQATHEIAQKAGLRGARPAKPRL
jgi:TetR/AcrR family transcriptional regulator, transcriptional repressor for nem operon